ncbi:MAG TPA: ATP-binding protein [Pyrinomonadaceae bacterium]|nr:ATP-binding protein [Pyrinomonadaceae bacterium]
MTRYSILLLALGCLIVAFILLSLSFSLGALALAGLSFLAGFLLFRSSLKPSHSSETGNRTSETPASEIFALGKLFEATLGGMREGLLVVDSDLCVVASNPAAYRLFNFASGKLDSRRLTELTRNPAIYSAFLEALQGNELSGVKVETHDPDRRIFDLRVVPLGVAGRKNSAGAIGVFFDITQLEKLERVRQEFLSNVSHELRTPLTAILAFVETLEAGALDDPENSQRFLAIIRKNAARMQSLIDDILELSAIESGTTGIQAQTVELLPLANDVITSLAGQATTRNVTVRNQVSAGTRVFADPKRLEQMLTNLVENAIKFNHEGGEVIIECEDGIRSRIRVRDTGVGIPAQHLERLFERFYRVDRARSRELGGTGLGLAIVKHLARAHGGEVRVRSEVGEGSVFEIDLPSQPAENIALAGTDNVS